MRSECHLIHMLLVCQHHILKNAMISVYIHHPPNQSTLQQIAWCSVIGYPAVHDPSALMVLYLI